MKVKFKEILEAIFFCGMILTGVSIFKFIFASSVISLIHVGIELNETSGVDIMGLISTAVKRNTIFLVLFAVCLMGYFVIKNARRIKNK